MKTVDNYDPEAGIMNLED